MKQRAVTIIATYLSKRPLGRLVRVRPVGADDYIVAIEDVRDGRTHLIHSAGDLGQWLRSFKEGRCMRPVAAICGRCDRLHTDRDVDGELLANCIRCCAELMVVGAERLMMGWHRREPATCLVAVLLELPVPSHPRTGGSYDVNQAAGMFRIAPQ